MKPGRPKRPGEVIKPRQRPVADKHAGRRPSRKTFETAPVDVDPVASSPGWFKTRLVPGGAWVPARMWLVEQRDEETGDLIADVQYFAALNGKEVSALSPPGWPWVQITEQEHQYLVDLEAWSVRYDPKAPIANPTVPMRQLERNYV